MAQHLDTEPPLLPPPPQLDQSFLTALAEEVSAKADIKGNLRTYKYYDNVSPGTVARWFWRGCRDKATAARAAQRWPARTSPQPPLPCPPLPQVWQFLLKDVSFRLNPTGQGSARKAPEIKADVIKLVCVEYKLATSANPAG